MDKYSKGVVLGVGTFGKVLMATHKEVRKFHEALLAGMCYAAAAPAARRRPPRPSSLICLTPLLPPSIPCRRAKWWPSRRSKWARRAR